jgi:hypothetical protein
VKRHALFCLVVVELLLAAFLGGHVVSGLVIKPSAAQAVDG